jgi:hypothetical protein
MNAVFPASVKSFGSERLDGDYIPADDMNSVRAEIVALETAALSGGWISDPLPWSYASASTFTVPANLTAVFTKGLRLKWTQTSQKYGVVVASSYPSGTGLTTVSIAVNTDYPLTNAAISANAYSNLDNPRGWQRWFNYSPALTWTAGTAPSSPTINNALFRLDVDSCAVQYFWNGTAGLTVTALTIALPVTAVPTNQDASGFIGINTVPNATHADIAGGLLRLQCTSSSASRFHASALYGW